MAAETWLDPVGPDVGGDAGQRAEMGLPGVQARRLLSKAIRSRLVRAITNSREVA